MPFFLRRKKILMSTFWLKNLQKTITISNIYIYIKSSLAIIVLQFDHPSDPLDPHSKTSFINNFSCSTSMGSPRLPFFRKPLCASETSQQPTSVAMSEYRDNHLSGRPWNETTPLSWNFKRTVGRARTKLTARPWKMMIGRPLSYYKDGPFLGAMLNFGDVGSLRLFWGCTNENQTWIRVLDLWLVEFRFTLHQKHVVNVLLMVSNYRIIFSCKPKHKHVDLFFYHRIILLSSISSLKQLSKSLYMLHVYFQYMCVYVKQKLSKKYMKKLPCIYICDHFSKTSHSFTLPARNPPVNPTACPLCRGYSTGSSGIFSGIFPSPPLLSKKANTLVKGSFNKNPTEIANKSGCLFFGVSGFQKKLCLFSLVEKTNDTRRISMNSSRFWSWNLKKSMGPSSSERFVVIETSRFEIFVTRFLVQPAGPTSFGAIFWGSLTTMMTRSSMKSSFA